MFYKPYKPRRKRLRRGCLSRILKLLILAVAVYVCILVYTSASVGDFFSSIMPGGLPLGYSNILLLGVDEASQANSRSDTMIVASISNSGSVKLTSLMRDTLVNIDGYGTRKLNAAYAYGGGDLAVSTVNKNFGLNISYYAVVDFSGFTKIIDDLGGVRLPITKAEMQAMNQKKGHALAAYGDNILLDGTQALRYVRIRKIDTDYQRSNRQRRLISALLDSLRSVKNPVKLIGIVKSVMSSVKTNMNVVSIAINAIKAINASSPVKQLRIPAEGTYESGILDGIWSIRADLDANAKTIRDFIYSN